MVRFHRIRAVAILCFSVAAQIGTAQHRVDPRNTYERVLAIVPVTGLGIAGDEVRPMYAPASALPTPAGALPKTAIAVPGKVGIRPGILAFTYILSDDGKFALVEYVAADRSALSSILADSSIKKFLKGKDNAAAVEAEFKKYRKDFALSHFGSYVQ